MILILIRDFYKIFFISVIFSKRRFMQKIDWKMIVFGFYKDFLYV
ncbi:hypothetical protein LEP1GSC059_3158 [Leptospira noguchii serovar Panama str. CZ214]|uniref:Uncharacterized protein n=1 Tax=Leptospira noguchii serovar Panama str. CZ214 TaxID=1001595 RepID=T0FN62_9LEPT|nr:hypothetical protein LEP1GSC059_3158 [Leptospira noguchii serovar Panama str. CZ214]